MKYIAVFIILMVVVSSAVLYNFVSEETKEGTGIKGEYQGDDSEKSIKTSECVNSARIACVPKGGRFNLVTGDVTDKSGKIVSTESERNLNG